MLKTACQLLLTEDDKMHVPGLDCAAVSSSAGTETEPYILKLGNMMNLPICTEFKYETYSVSRLKSKYNAR
jgi:hypothetical protein